MRNSWFISCPPNWADLATVSVIFDRFINIVNILSTDIGFCLLSYKSWQQFFFFSSIEWESTQGFQKAYEPNGIKNYILERFIEKNTKFNSKHMQYLIITYPLLVSKGKLKPKKKKITYSFFFTLPITYSLAFSCSTPHCYKSQSTNCHFRNYLR